MLAPQELISAVKQMTDLLVAVATGGPRINEVNNEYRRLRDIVASELSSRGLSIKIPFGDLWEWYGRFSGGDFPSWRSRREFINGFTKLQIAEIQSLSASTLASIEPTGWERVDRTVGAIRDQLASASSEEQFQAVGLLCREAIISVGQAVYDQDRHPPLDGVAPSSTDAKRMLEAYIAVEMAGGHNKIARSHARAAFDLANELQHRRTASFRDAALCVEATTTVVNVVAIVSGRRDP